MMKSPSTTTAEPAYFLLGIQTSRQGLQLYNLWSPLRQNVHSPRPYLMRLTADQIQQRQPASGAHEGMLHCWMVLNEVLRRLVHEYCAQRKVHFTLEGLQAADQQINQTALAPTLSQAVHLYPPAPVLRDEIDEERYLRQQQSDVIGLVTELFLLKLHHTNPALNAIRPLFDDAALQRSTDYRQLLVQLDESLSGFPGGSLSDRLWDLLRAPIEASPHSLEGQLYYLRSHWGHLLPDSLLEAIDRSYALIAEILASRELGQGEPQGFGLGDAKDQARFTPDADWMPRTVLLAKSTHVWLSQLSVRYNRTISRLDQIPDEELDQIAEQGFTALWLIGAWQRADSSRKIKHLRGQTEAHASAYALDEYRIADDLGGEAARQNLQDRCAARGVRLACDVVPNHTGLDSRWMRERPDEFIQTDYPPYPSYRFTGTDLSDDPDISLRIEDGYYDNSDAAVVFEHRDHRSGRVRYIYHGNDGTHTPWNDTAQLDYLNPEVRERMIQQILEVARHFSVIRFDAAMTLAKKHFQRLWYPSPGGGVGVPSRGDHALDDREFHRRFPVEFWREVVDRIQAEVPDTLLVAEAFWLMEGYFVRTLGMHRVYNSAFMNMLKHEHNDRYRTLIKDVLLLNPGVLQRFVNFLSNPDEETAVEQFGRDDKYFGATTLLATLPGLPLFAHGQIQGLQEKYGMEFRRAQWQEQEDPHLIERHRHQIFPLLRQRGLFSGAEQFQLYDFHTEWGVNEQVYAYSNRTDGHGALVLFNNQCADTAGWIQYSVDKRLGDAAEGAPLARCNLAEGLGLSVSDRLYRYTDQVSGLQYLRTGAQLAQEGLYVELGAYGHQVLWQFSAIDESDDRWRRLWQRLGGHGALSLEQELDAEGPSLPTLARRKPAAQQIARPLRILTVSSEVAPLAKTGGLADVTGALPAALEDLGHHNRIIMPGYPSALANADNPQQMAITLELPLAGSSYAATVWQTRVKGVPTYLIQQDALFGREGLYGDADGDYPDNPLRFAFFSRAALELTRQLDFQPDIVHVHDWQTALIPAMLQTDYAEDPFFSSSLSLLTVHNLGYQGMMAPHWLTQLELHPALGTVEGMEYYGRLSMLKGGIQCAERINTVSPTYGKEVLTPEIGQGFDGLLRSRSRYFSGILNGLDTQQWDPHTDAALEAGYSAEAPAGKAVCKAELQRELGLPQQPEVPIIAVVSRLDRQKGLNLLLEQWDALMQRPLQLVILGTGDRHLMEQLRRHQQRFPSQAATLLTFDEPLARRIYAGSDLFLMPSLYEPCGLSQLIALRYGAVPIVRRTGGLADTVVDASQPMGNGFVFEAFTGEAMLEAIDRALTLWQQTDAWTALRKTGMTQDFSWKASAKAYVQLFLQALAAPNER